MSEPPGHPVATPAGRAFHFRCLRCRSVLEGRSDQCGQRAQCPSCGAIFTVPDVDPRTGLAIRHADPGDDGENPTPVHAYATAGDKAPRILRLDDDTLVIECPRCERRSAIKADNCEHCGLPFTLEGADYRVVTTQSGRGTPALVLGILSLVLCLPGLGAVLGVIAIALGLHAWRRAGRASDSGLAIAGILLGALGCVISLVLLLG